MTSCACGVDAGFAIFKNRNRTLRITVSGPGDLTGAKIWFSVKASRDDVVALITKRSLNNGGTDAQAVVINGVGGVIEIYIDPADTISMATGEYLFDVVIETAAGKKIEAVQPSIMKVLQPVTMA